MRDFVREFVPGMALIAACIFAFGFGGGFLVHLGFSIDADWAILLGAYAGAGAGIAIGNLVAIRYLGWMQ